MHTSSRSTTALMKTGSRLEDNGMAFTRSVCLGPAPNPRFDIVAIRIEHVGRIVSVPALLGRSVVLAAMRQGHGVKFVHRFPAGSHEGQVQRATLRRRQRSA